MTAGPITVYADTILAYSVRAPGIVRVDLALPLVEGEDPQPVLRLILPIDVARRCAGGLTKVVENHTEEADEPPAPEGMMRFTTMTSIALMASALANMARQLGGLVASRPDLSEQFAQIERKVLRDADNAVAEGISIDEEADAMRVVRDKLIEIFADIRSQGPKEPGPKRSSGEQ